MCNVLKVLNNFIITTIIYHYGRFVVFLVSLVIMSNVVLYLKF